MATIIEQFSKEIMLPLPFKQIFYFAKKERVPYLDQMAIEIKILTEINKKEIIDLLSKSIIKAMKEDISMGKISSDTLEEMKTKIDYLNSRFKHINDFFEGLESHNQRKLLLPFINDESASLSKYKDRFRTDIISKVNWNLNDSLMYPYYLLYQDHINYWKVSLKKSKKNTIRSRLDNIKNLMVFYKPVIFAYIQGNPLPNEILVKRIAELRGSLNPGLEYPQIAPKVYKAIETISFIPPILD